VLAECATNHLAEPQIVGGGVGADGGVQLGGEVNEQGDASGPGWRAVQSELTGQRTAPPITGDSGFPSPVGECTSNPIISG
jgi:hypothetical protein